MVIPTWAEALKSTEAHIRAWLTYNPEEEEEDQVSLLHCITQPPKSQT